MKNIKILTVLMLVGLLAVGCSQEPELTTPDSGRVYNMNKNGTETLGAPDIEIAAGSGFAQGGVGMVAPTDGVIDITVPAGATVQQVLLYWSGGTTGAPGDDTIKIDGNEVTGSVIGGPTLFFTVASTEWWFTSYRADITGLDLVSDGVQTFTFSDLEFDNTGSTHSENGGVSMLVIYDDGSVSELTILDGLDLAFFKFVPTLDGTTPQTFTFAAESEDRTADFIVFAGSVESGRPNRIAITNSAGTYFEDNLLGSVEGPLWDSITVPVQILAGDTSLTVELISWDSDDGLGASMSWIGTGLSVPVTEEELFCLGDFVWIDENGNGCQDDGEMGVEGIEVHLWSGCTPGEVIATTVTDADGHYMFCGLMPGDYTVQFEAPDGYIFCEQYAEGCGSEFDSNAGEGGITDCVTIVDADDYTIDAGLCMPPTASLGDFVWEDLDRDGVQDDGEPGIEGVMVSLFDCQGQFIASTTTDALGYYLFEGLMAGEYYLAFEQPDGMFFSPQDMGNDDAVDSDVDPVTGETVCITLEAGDIDLTWDAGLFFGDDDCAECDGKITELTMRYHGDEAGYVEVYTKGRDAHLLFEGTVGPGEDFSFVGDDKHGTMGTEITFMVDGEENTKIHTSCSKPIGVGLISGDFEIIAGASRNGGALCPIDNPPPGEDCDECDGKITALTMRYHGDEAGYVEVFTKGRDAHLLFEGTVGPGEDFSFVGDDRHGTMGTEIKLMVDGEENTKIHTSCSDPIGVGMISGDFEIIAGRSRNGGDLCPVDTPPEGDCGECDGKVTALTLRYHGDEAGYVEVYTKGRDAHLLFEGTVEAGEDFSFVGDDKHGTMGTEIKLMVDGEENVKIHTSCSRPIDIGSVFGDFEVIFGSSRNGGDFCPVDGKVIFGGALRATTNSER